MSKKNKFYILLGLLSTTYATNGHAAVTLINCDEAELDTYTWGSYQDTMDDMLSWSESDFEDNGYDPYNMCEEFNEDTGACNSLNRPYVAEQLCGEAEQYCQDYLKGNLECASDCDKDYYWKVGSGCQPCPQYCIGDKCINGQTASSGINAITQCYIPSAEYENDYTDARGTYKLILNENCYDDGSV